MCHLFVMFMYKVIGSIFGGLRYCSIFPRKEGFFDVKGCCYAISYIVKGRQVVLHEAKSTRLGKCGGRKQNKQLGQMEVGDIEKYSWGKWG